jgi:uncharacterized MnhB-related membrane protein
MSALQIWVLLLLAISALGVVLNREPLRQTIAISYYGILLGVVFYAFRAPDVALSQIVIGAVVLPLMTLLAIGRVKAEAQRRARTRKEAA